MTPPGFTFLTAVGTAGLSETAARHMRSHVTKSNFAKRRARIATNKKEATNKSSYQLSPENLGQSVVTTNSRPGSSQTVCQQTRGDSHAQILSLRWSLLLLDTSKYPAAISEAAWISLLISKPATVESFIVFGLRHWSPDKDYQEVLCDHSSKATKNIIQHIDSGRGTTDAVLAAVLTIAFGERLVHNDLAWNIHIDGAVQMVNERRLLGLPAMSPLLEDILINDIINDMFGFPRLYHKKFVNAARTARDDRCSSLIRMADLCDNLACWMQRIDASRRHPQSSDFIMEHIMQPMHYILSETRDMRANGSSALKASCIAVELIIYLSWGPLPVAINLTAVANELKEAICAVQCTPCCYSDLTSCQLMIGAMASDEGSPTRAWFIDRQKIAWQMVKSRGSDDAMDILERNMTCKRNLERQFKSLWMELDSQ
ncbi:hypothetical protein F5Y12DRAFT_663562 [Xylaria sp. FL1777]|nr:hypothetical protein F5Y12DRAFT_663562 [Xylaria sp. FL1777]